MDWIFNISIFISCAVLLYFAGEIIVKALLRISRYFGVTEFVVAFFVMAVAASLPNLLVGITSAMQGIPELSFGDVMGNNIIAMTIAVGLAIFFSPNKEIPAESKIVQHTSFFTIVAALLPIVLISDGNLTRADGVILISFFAYYIFWLFSKKERYTKVYEEHEILVSEAKFVFSDFFKVLGGVAMLIVSAQGIVYSATFMAEGFGVSLVIVGILILGLGSALPEIYFAISSARKNEVSMILGNLMGAVIIPASLILGIIALITPIKSEGFESFAVSRVFVIIAALLFLFFSYTGKKISKKEGVVLILIYFIFVATVIYLK